MKKTKLTKSPRRRCKICREWFNPRFPNEWWCGPEHGTEYALMLRQKEKLKQEQQRKKEAQQERRHHQIHKLEVKPLSYFHSKAQAAFNQFVRIRDAEQPCTRGASPATRYDETNCHKQCVPCNQHLSGNIENYTPNLIERIGLEAFDILMGPHPVKK